MADAKADILPLVREFYTVQAVDYLTQTTLDPFKATHSGWQNRLHEYRDRYTRKLGEAIFDYTVLVCAGEARHGKAKAAAYHPEIPQVAERSTVYAWAKAYNPQQLLRATVAAFSVTWGTSYGGKRWLDIAELGLLYYEIPTGVWIDHVVDLCHNGGPYFNKGSANILGMGSSGDLKIYLDNKATESPYWVLGQPRSDMLTAIIVKGIALGILPSVQHTGDSTPPVQTVLNYTPVTWGGKEIGTNLVTKGPKTKPGTKTAVTNVIPAPAPAPTQWGIINIPEYAVLITRS